MYNKNKINVRISVPLHFKILLGFVVLCIIIQMLGLYDFSTLMSDKPKKSTPNSNSSLINHIVKYTKTNNKFITKWYPPNSDWVSLIDQSMGKKFISIENSAAECDLYPECVSFVFNKQYKDAYWLGKSRIFENVPGYSVYSK